MMEERKKQAIPGGKRKVMELSEAALFPPSMPSSWKKWKRPLFSLSPQY